MFSQLTPRFRARSVAKVAPLCILLASATLALATANPAYWTGDGYSTSHNWGQTNNWVSNGNPDAGGSGVIHFGGSGANNPFNNYGDYTQFDQIYFDLNGAGTHTGTATTSFQLDGHVIKLFSSGSGVNAAKIENNSAAAQTVNFNPSGDAILMESNIQLNPVAGDLTINGAIRADNGGGLIEVYGSGHNLYLNGTFGQYSTTGSLTVQGNTNVYLNAQNTFSGQTTVNAGVLTASNGSALGSTSSITVNSTGTLALGNNAGAYTASDHINNSAGVTLDGGTFNTNGLSEHGASNNTAGIGKLTLSSTSIIDMASGSSVIAFANSNTLLGGPAWTGTLKIYNWSGTPITGGGTDQLYIGSDATGLSATQLQEIQFYSGNGTGLFTGPTGILSNGEIVPIPEPGTWAAGILAVAALGYSQCRRLSRRS